METVITIVLFVYISLFISLSYECTRHSSVKKIFRSGIKLFFFMLIGLVGFSALLMIVEILAQGGR